MKKARPITQKAKSSPFKMNESLVAGAGFTARGFSDLSAGFKGGVEPLKQQPGVKPPSKEPKAEDLKDVTLEETKTSKELGLYEEEEDFDFENDI